MKRAPAGGLPGLSLVGRCALGIIRALQLCLDSILRPSELLVMAGSYSNIDATATADAEYGQPLGVPYADDARSLPRRAAGLTRPEPQSTGRPAPSPRHGR
jgi:hypothetical protein